MDVIELGRLGMQIEWYHGRLLIKLVYLEGKSVVY